MKVQGYLPCLLACRVLVQLSLSIVLRILANFLKTIPKPLLAVSQFTSHFKGTCPPCLPCPGLGYVLKVLALLACSVSGRLNHETKFAVYDGGFECVVRFAYLVQFSLGSLGSLVSLQICIIMCTYKIAVNASASRVPSLVLVWVVQVVY